MTLRNTPEHWGGIAKSFHWVMAVLIIGLMILGWVAEGWSLSPTKVKLFVWHKSLGIVILSLAVLRLIWRAFNPPPALPGAVPRFERLAARLSHAALYVVMIVMPLSGWIINSAADFPLKLFWLLRLPHIVEPSERVQDFAETVHLTLFWLFALLLVVHISAALRHHFAPRNEILTRMLPGKR